MKRFELKYPIALHKITKTLINAKDALNGKNCECICYSCGKDMVAINKVKIQKEHFRHEANSQCSASYESYIHWLSKEIFREIDFINLPDLSDSYFSQFEFSKLENLYNEYSVPQVFRNKFTNEILNNINSKIKNVKIKTIEIEKSYTTNTGAVIRVDIVLKFDNKSLFIEPYFTNPINDLKLNNLRELNISTVSINLIDFIANKNHLYSKEELKEFIINDLNSKSWVYLKKEAILTDRDFKDLDMLT